MKPKTYNRGADEERSKWIRKINYLMRELAPNSPVRAKLEALKQWGKGRADRNRKKAGGL